MGLSQREHFHWARTQGHPAEDISAQANQEVRQAVHYELTHGIEDIEEERRALARRWIDMARASKAMERQWLPDTPLATRPVVSRLAVPMVRLLISETLFPDKALGDDILGFPLLETLPPVSTPARIDRPSRVQTHCKAQPCGHIVQR